MMASIAARFFSATSSCGRAYNDAANQYQQDEYERELRRAVETRRAREEHRDFGETVHLKLSGVRSRRKPARDLRSVAQHAREVKAAGATVRPTEGPGICGHVHNSLTSIPLRERWRRPAAAPRKRKSLSRTSGSRRSRRGPRADCGAALR